MAATAAGGGERGAKWPASLLHATDGEPWRLRPGLADHFSVSRCYDAHLCLIDLMVTMKSNHSRSARLHPLAPQHQLLITIGFTVSHSVTGRH
jgi:hypothetical protein